MACASRGDACLTPIPSALSSDNPQLVLFAAAVRGLERNPGSTECLLKRATSPPRTAIKKSRRLFCTNLGFPCGSAGKESACNAGDLGWENPLEKGMATHSSLLAWRRAWTSPWGGKESDTTERLSLSLSVLIRTIPKEKSLKAGCLSICNLLSFINRDWARENTYAFIFLKFIDRLH